MCSAWQPGVARSSSKVVPFIGRVFTSLVNLFSCYAVAAARNIIYNDSVHTFDHFVLMDTCGDVPADVCHLVFFTVRQVTLVSSDGQEFEVSELEARRAAQQPTASRHIYFVPAIFAHQKRAQC